MEELKAEREKKYQELEKQKPIQQGKSAWKKDHPNETIKHYKQLYIKGLIDSLPWENYQSTDNYKRDSD